MKFKIGDIVKHFGAIPKTRRFEIIKIPAVGLYTLEEIETEDIFEDIREEHLEFEETELKPIKILIEDCQKLLSRTI